MKVSKWGWVLCALLALNVILAFLLTPLGFESRPPADLTALGFVAIGTVFLGIVLDVVAIVFLLAGRTRAASTLAIAGSVLFVVPNVVDRTGSFFALPIPPTVNVLEYAFMALLAATIVVAWRVRAPARPRSTPNVCPQCGAAYNPCGYRDEADARCEVCHAQLPGFGA